MHLCPLSVLHSPNCGDLGKGLARMTNPAIAFVLAHFSELELDGQFGICDTEWTTVYIAQGKKCKGHWDVFRIHAAKAMPLLGFGP